MKSSSFRQESQAASEWQSALKLSGYDNLAALREVG